MENIEELYNNRICDYGCGEKANYVFKNGKCCCTSYTSSCPAMIKKISFGGKGLKRSSETRAKISVAQKGKIVSEATRKKLSDINKGKKGGFWEGKHLSEETRIKISESKIGKPNNWLGRKHTEEAKTKMSAFKKVAYIGKGNPRYGKHCSEETKQKIRENRYKNGVHKIINPNKKEKFVMELLKDYNFKYTGNFSLWIDGKNPDFINEEKKLIIEFFGSYWHGEKLRCLYGDITSNEDHEKQRIDHFQKHGYKCLVIWEHELKDIDKLLIKINNFLGII